MSLQTTDEVLPKTESEAAGRGISIGEDRYIAVGHDPVTEKVLGYIKAHFAEELDSRQIARNLGISDRYLRQRFKACVEKAQDLISYSDYAMKVISELSGFKSIHHFTRAFREVVGMTPGTWRTRYQEGIWQGCVH